MIELFDKFNDTVIYKEGNTLQNQIELLKIKLRNSSLGEIKTIEREIKKYEYGLKGEAKIIYELKNSHIPMYILHDITIEYKGYKAQIDFVIFTKKNCFILECKNLYGNLLIDHKGNFYREWNGRLSAIYSPITQLERHINVIKEYILDKNSWLGKLIVNSGFDDYYHGVVVLSNDNMVINDRNAPTSIKNRVVRADKITSYIRNIERNSKNYSNSEKEIKEFSDRIIALCVDENVDRNLEEIKINENVNNSNCNIRNEISSDVLRDKLKKYRYQKALELGYKPYFIFTDRTLNELVMRRPKTKEQLMMIEGIAEKKISQYGSDILRIINGE